MDILRDELHKVAEMWNQHIIVPSKFANNNGPRGRPDVMFFYHIFLIQKTASKKLIGTK